MTRKKDFGIIDAVLAIAGVLTTTFLGFVSTLGEGATSLVNIDSASLVLKDLFSGFLLILAVASALGAYAQYLMRTATDLGPFSGPIKQPRKTSWIFYIYYISVSIICIYIFSGLYGVILILCTLLFIAVLYIGFDTFDSFHLSAKEKLKKLSSLNRFARFTIENMRLILFVIFFAPGTARAHYLVNESPTYEFTMTNRNYIGRIVIANNDYFLVKSQYNYLVLLRTENLISLRMRPER